MTTRRWNLTAKDQAGNDISEQVSAEFDAILEATRLEQIAPGRISLLFLLSFFGAYKAGRINPFQVAREIEALEKGETTGLKPPIQNRHPPLKGLWHKHYMQPGIASLAMNIQHGLKRFGIPYVQQKVREATEAGEKRFFTIEDITPIANDAVQGDWLKEEDATLPLDSMSDEERLVADYAGMGLTVGHHPMHYRRKELRCRGFLTASDLQRKRTGEYVRTAGLAIVKQRPGTANGMVFMSIADETGIFNVMVTKEFFERNRETVVLCKFISLEGPLQNEGGVIHIRSTRMSPLPQRGLEVESHDFH